MANSNTKTCNTCQEEKPITKFAKTGNRKYRNKVCRSCQHKKQKLNPRYVMSRMLSMAKLRCEDSTHKSFPTYGGRGIKFKLDREEFYQKFEKRVEGYIKSGVTPSIDRIDSDGHYEMANIQIIPNYDNTAEMRSRMSDRYKQKRILAEQASHKKCKSCNKNVPTKDYYISKRHRDGTVSRYNKCPKCEQEHRVKAYSSKPYYKGKTK